MSNLTLLGVGGSVPVAVSKNTKSISLAKASLQYTSITNDLGIVGGTATIECWVNIASNPAAGSFYNIMQTQDGGNKVGYVLEYRENAGNYDLSFQREKLWVADQKATWSSANLALNTWVHLAGTYDNTDMRLFTAAQGAVHTLRAGPTAASGNGTTNGADGSAIGGGDEASGANYVIDTNRTFDGLIDDARAWNVARTTAQLDDNDELEVSASSAGLVGYWKLNGNANDATANAFNMTESGGPTYSTNVAF